MKISICNDINRIRSFMDRDDIKYRIAQDINMPYDIKDNNNSYYLMASYNDEDIVLYILDPLSYKNHYNIHVGSLYKAKGFLSYSAGILMTTFVESIIDHGCLIGMVPNTKLYAVKYAESIGFNRTGIVPNSIQITDTIGTHSADMIIVTYTW